MELPSDSFDTYSRRRSSVGEGARRASRALSEMSDAVSEKATEIAEGLARRSPLIRAIFTLILQITQSPVTYWSCFSVVTALMFILRFGFTFPYSRLLTLASVCSTFGFMMVALTIEGQRSCAGISRRMMELYVIVCSFRMVSILPADDYLPADSSGDYLYRVMEVLSFIFALYIVFQCRVKFPSTYDSAIDTVNTVYLVVPCALLAIVFHPSLNNFKPADISWVFALYLESVTVIPQLFMFQKRGKVASYTTHFLAGQALSKACSFVFWIHSYHELSDPGHELKWCVGLWVVVMQVGQLLVMCDFIYHYIQCIRKGIPVTFLISEDV